MIDFAKLNDPVWRDQQRQAREADEARLEAKEKLLNTAISLCLATEDALTNAERSLVWSCRNRLNTYLPLSEKQEKWLLDIAKRLRVQRDARITDLVARVAQGDRNGEHPEYPRSDWPAESTGLNADYWDWVLFLVELPSR